jgi:Family of unknown function (DUF5706)
MTVDPGGKQVIAAIGDAGKDLPGGAEAPLLRSSAVGSESDTKQPSAQPVPSDAHVDFAEQTHQYVREYIRNADQKAAFFFAAATAGLGYLLTHHAVAGWVKTPVFASADCVWLVAVLGLAVGAGFFLSVVFPRLQSSSPGLIFFNEIAAHPSAIEYTEGVLATPAAEIARTKLRHLYDLATICRKKFSALRRGARIGVVGGVATIVYLAIQA